MFFLIKEKKNTKTVMTLKIDNTEDVKQYINIYNKEYSNGLSSMQNAWKFIEKDKTDTLIKSFAELLVRRENAKPRPKVTYMRTTLGMVFKMNRDAQNKVTDYKLISTPTYQEIIGMNILKNGKIICELENGGFLFGDDNGLKFMPMPKSLQKKPEIKPLTNNRILMVDANFNIFYTDYSFNWKQQLEFNYEQKELKVGLFANSLHPILPKIYFGKKHIYIYAPSDDKHKILLQSENDELHFKSIPISKIVKKIPMVSETSTHLFIGPHTKLSATAKRPAYMYVKQHEGSDWEIRNLPRGDCKRFVQGKNENTLYTECSKNNWFESNDIGKTWKQWKPTKTATN